MRLDATSDAIQLDENQTMFVANWQKIECYLLLQKLEHYSLARAIDDCKLFDCLGTGSGTLALLTSR